MRELFVFTLPRELYLRENKFENIVFGIIARSRIFASTFYFIRLPLSYLNFSIFFRSSPDIEQKDGGTQLKLVIDYGDTTEALFKPMR